LDGAVTTSVPAPVEEPPEDWPPAGCDDAAAITAIRIIDTRTLRFAIRWRTRAGQKVMHAGPPHSADLWQVANDA
jgi:hypothetical protein